MRCLTKLIDKIFLYLTEEIIIVRDDRNQDYTQMAL